MSSLADLYPLLRARLEQSVPPDWPEISQQVKRYLLARDLPPILLLAPASCAATGEAPEKALSISVAVAWLLLAMRWFDDLEDRDRPGSLADKIGPAKAANLASAALTRAWGVLVEDDNLPREVCVEFSTATVKIAKGQHLDLDSVAVSLDTVWDTMAGKTGAAYAFATKAGGLAGNASMSIIEELGYYGEQLGVLLQLLDDLEGVFSPNGLGDLALNKINLPLMFALLADHPQRDRLRCIVRERQMAHQPLLVRRILDSCDTRVFIAYAALQQRDEALDALSRLGTPPNDQARSGRNTLAEFCDLGFHDLQQLLSDDNTSCKVAIAAHSLK